MGELHNTYNDSACNYIVHALNALGELMDRRHTILNRMLIITASIFALVALMGAASATDYYVSTTGDNGASGDLTHPWQNVSYATQQAVAGDTIYQFYTPNHRESLQWYMDSRRCGLERKRDYDS
jgi:hypothetical protein